MGGCTNGRAIARAAASPAPGCAIVAGRVRGGAALAAISPETPDNAMETQETNELGFLVLSDRRNAVARASGFANTLPKEAQERFMGRFDRGAYNGDDSDDLPLSATSVIDRAGVERYAFGKADYRTPAEPRRSSRRWTRCADATGRSWGLQKCRWNR